MTFPLHESVPGFDEPIAVFKHCHDRIRKQLKTLQNLCAHLPQAGADLDAQQAATAVLRYFNEAAHNHHADEEQDLLPMLASCAQGDDAQLLAELAPRILADHVRMDTLWHAIDAQLQEVGRGGAADLSAGAVQEFCDAYAAHMVLEETHIAPMAKRLFSPAQMAALGNAMRRRRGITD